MNDLRQQTGLQFSLNDLWAMEPGAFERLRDLVANTSPERLAAAATQPAAHTPADTRYENSGGVAVIPFEGVVAKKQNLWSSIFGGRAVTTDTKAAVNAAVADPAVKSILMVIDSPGGTVDGTADLADAVYAANKVKPVTAYADDLMASAAYWVGSQAGRVVGNTTTKAGSVGVFSTIPDVSRMAKNMGIDVNIVKSASAKGAGTMGAPVTESQIAEVQRLVDATHSLFVGAVSRGRGKDMSAVADGRMHVGQDAVDLGLLDAIEPLSTTLSRMQQEAKMPDLTPTPAPVPVPVPAPAPVVAQTPAAAMASLGFAAATAPDYGNDIAAMRTRLDAVEKANLSTTVDGLISSADPRKLTPGLVSTARTIAQHGGVDALKAFIGSLPTTAPAGGSVQDAPKGGGLPEAPHPSDHVGIALSGYKADKGPAHQLAIAYMEKANAAGKKVSYYDAVVATTRKG